MAETPAPPTPTHERPVRRARRVRAGSTLGRSRRRDPLTPHRRTTPGGPTASRCTPQPAPPRPPLHVLAASRPLTPARPTSPPPSLRRRRASTATAAPT